MWKVTTISGVAGGPTREATVNLKVETLSDTVEEVRAKVEALPQLVEALELAEATIERLNRHDSANGTLDVVRAALGREAP